MLRLFSHHSTTIRNPAFRTPVRAISSVRSMSSAPSSASRQNDLPQSDIPIFTSLASYRQWREEKRRVGETVGFVPTMGALHAGHLSLVRKSLAANDHTVLSIFVNPAQFAPHEDLATYPRTLPRDLEQLSATIHSIDGSSKTKKASAVFLPTVQDMYPSGITQDVAAQKGTFVEVKGYGHQMEGQSRPTFFRGVATVVLKLFNAVEPTNAYFGQKDIQQALLLRRMCRDLLLSHPTPENLHVVPTTRDQETGLALSSRNAYLSPDEYAFAPTVYKALKAAENRWDEGGTKQECVRAATDLVLSTAKEAQERGVHIKLDYIAVNDSDTFDVLGEDVHKDWNGARGNPVIVSGAVWVGKTRLIDNVLLSEDKKILIKY